MENSDLLLDIKQLEDDGMPVLHGPLGQRSPAVDELGPRDGAVAAGIERIEQQPRELPVHKYVGLCRIKSD